MLTDGNSNGSLVNCSMLRQKSISQRFSFMYVVYFNLCTFVVFLIGVDQLQ